MSRASERISEAIGACTRPSIGHSCKSGQTNLIWALERIQDACNASRWYYRNGNKMMMVSVTTSLQFTASAPKQLWEGNYSSGTAASCGMPTASSSNYDVTPDGQRFLMVRDVGGPSSTQIVVVLNWAEELKAKEQARSRAK